MRIRIRDPKSFWPWIRDGKIWIREHSGSATLRVTNAKTISMAPLKKYRFSRKQRYTCLTKRIGKSMYIVGYWSVPVLVQCRTCGFGMIYSGTALYSLQRQVKTKVQTFEETEKFKKVTGLQDNFQSLFSGRIRYIKSHANLAILSWKLFFLKKVRSWTDKIRIRPNLHLDPQHCSSVH